MLVAGNGSQFSSHSPSSSESQISGGTRASSRSRLSGSIWLLVSSCEESAASGKPGGMCKGESSWKTRLLDDCSCGNEGGREALAAAEDGFSGVEACEAVVACEGRTPVEERGLMGGREAR